jgi:hypothetical protein
MTEPVWLVWKWDEQVGTVGGWTEKEALENARKFFGGPPEFPGAFSHVTLGCGEQKKEKVEK